MKLELTEKKTIEVSKPSNPCCDMMKLALDERVYIPDYDGTEPKLYWFIKNPDKTYRRITVNFCYNCGEKVE